VVANPLRGGPVSDARARAQNPKTTEPPSPGGSYLSRRPSRPDPYKEEVRS
jgi:hypothetical protein